MTSHDYHLSVDGRYRIRSLASREATLETVGMFKGFAPVGSGDGLVFEIVEGENRGKLRIIPSHMVVAIDVLEPGKPQETKRSESEDRLYL